MRGKGSEFETLNGIVDACAWENGTLQLDLFDEEGWATTSARLEKEEVVELVKFLCEEFDLNE